MVEAFGEQWAHGGADALGVAEHDFSTNRNAFGPCPRALALVRAAQVADYPDPAYTRLRAGLAAFHGVPARHIVIGASASELIHRLSACAARQGAGYASLPGHCFGEYARAARAWGLEVLARPSARPAAQGPQQGLHWTCEPSSPLGRIEEGWPLLLVREAGRTVRDGPWLVLDCAYRPLWLEGRPPPRDLAGCWQLWTPNKALGMTGVRAAYAIAPANVADETLGLLHGLAPSWVLGAHGVAMLEAWIEPGVQSWLESSLARLREWKALQLELCASLGWQVLAGHQANYFVARPQLCGGSLGRNLDRLRGRGVKLRDCASFGLPGHVRLGVLAPASQDALRAAWSAISSNPCTDSLTA